MTTKAEEFTFRDLRQELDDAFNSLKRLRRVLDGELASTKCKAIDEIYSKIQDALLSYQDTLDTLDNLKIINFKV